MQYKSTCISAISKFMREMSFSKEHYVKVYGPHSPMYFDLILCTEKCSKCIYSCINFSSNTPSSVEKWNSKIFLMNIIM